MSRAGIPKKVIYRLSLYHRCLRNLEEKGEKTVSSFALAKVAGVKPSQLRKDLAFFGAFGTRGLGYSVPALTTTIREALGREHLQPVILVGAGNLGSALIRYDGFKKEGFEVVAAFDLDPKATRSRGLEVSVFSITEVSDWVSKNEIKLAILCVPAIAAQAVVNQLVEAGISGILNFSPIILQVPEKVVVNNVDLALELENLNFFVR